jgi:hypothetical protein
VSSSSSCSGRTSQLRLTTTKAELELNCRKSWDFVEGATYNRNSRGLESAVAIVEVNEGGVFHHAGFRPGDALPRESHTSLFKRLHRSRGRAVEFAVVDSGDGPPYSTSGPYASETASDVKATQSHALEPAAGSVSNGESSPPAQ